MVFLTGEKYPWKPIGKKREKLKGKRRGKPT